MNLYDCKLEREAGMPLYLQLHGVLKEFVTSDSGIQAGKLPGEHELGKLFGVSRNTVTQALKMLADENLIRRIRNRGTVITAALELCDPQSPHRAIGLVFPISSRWGAALDALEQEAIAHKYSLEIYSYQWMDPADERRAFERARRNCAGVIFYPGGSVESRSFVAEIGSIPSPVPVVLFDIYYEEFDTNAISTNTMFGGYQLARWLLSRGCRRIACFTWLPYLGSVSRKLDGFRKAMAESGVELLPELYGEIKSDHADPAMIRSVLAQHPDGIFCTCFYADLLSEMRHSNLAQLPLAQFDIAPAGWEDFDMLTAQMPKDTLAREAVRLLCKRLYFPDIRNQLILLAPQLIPQCPDKTTTTRRIV